MTTTRSLTFLVSGILLAAVAVGPAFAGKGETGKSGVTGVPGGPTGPANPTHPTADTRSGK